MSRWKPFIWFGISLLCFAAAIWFWQWGERRAERDAAQPVEETHSSPVSSSGTGDFHLVSQPAIVTNDSAPAVFQDEVFPYRLRNTPASMGELVRSDTAVLLENALMDTARGSGLAIPDHLRAQGDPGTYIAQARGAITEEFRALITAAGGTVVSYVPNNAYLIRASAGAAATVGASPLSQSVIPFEPYYKIKGELLETAVKQKPLPRAMVLSLVLFADAQESTVEALNGLGGVVLAEDRSPFGPVAQVQVPRDALAAVAGLPGVQIVDRAYDRVLANDLSRERIGVSENSSNAPNYLQLTGDGITLQIVDSGVDKDHPDLVGRVLGDSAASLQDIEGHGTHVAGTIAGDGAVSTSVSNAPPGSGFPISTNQFRGMAPEATLYSIAAITDGDPPPSDSELQESAALNGALICNNSWNQLDASYNILAASYDAAVRDSLPLTNGSQPVLYVFAAGNTGAGSDEGSGGIPDSILSPATAKNVITVGAIENFRDITNDVVICEDGDTNNCETFSEPFKNETDTDWEVAGFSSRGNVGIGLEGEFGRFKPDVVAPGTFVLSTRSDQWDTNAYYDTREREVNTIFSDPILPGEVNGYLAFIPENAVEFQIVVSTPAAQPPLPDLPIYVDTTGFPESGDTPLGTNSVTIPPDRPLTPLDDIWFYGVGNPTDQPLFVNVTTIITTTNNNPVTIRGLQDLNAGVAPDYRYESGTSMAAPAISGALALIQEFFQERLQKTISPALLKAFVINGSRSTNPFYDFQVNNVVNNQGWGVFNLPNVIPASTNLNGATGAPVFYYDQSPTNALATGQSDTRNLTLALAAQNQSMRFTLVWTDPPGNPVVGAKLVNNLDLIVTNLDNGEVYFGNNIPAGSDFNQAYDPSSTNAIPDPDVVNNVENVYLPAFTGTNFTVTVVGRRVNVNAVYDHPDNTVQDYALVISSGEATVDTAITVTASTSADDPSPEVNFLGATLINSNVSATLLENQLAGENTPLLGTTNGITNQWHFYALTNSAGWSNAVFITFLPSTLSLPRMGVFADDEEDSTRLEADIDLYVSTDSGLTNLDQTVLDGADKSLGRGGTEAVVLDDAVAGQVYYVGVKSEDHEAANYRFFGAFSRLPLSEDDDGDLVLQGIPVPYEIPDGSPSAPGAALVLAVAVEPIEIRRVIVTNEVTHQNMGDLIGNLSHDSKFAVLNNHTFPDNDDTITNYTYVYEDNGEGDIPGAQTTDGPGSLKDFVGEEGLGVWLLTMLDDSLSQTGRVDDLQIRLERSPETNVYTRTIAPRSWFYDVVDVPPEATNFTIQVEIIGSQPLPVELFIRQGDFPTFGLFDAQTTIFPPGGQASISIFDVPPLVPDLYYFGIYNPNTVAQEVQITILIELGLDQRDTQDFSSFGESLIKDNAVSYASQFVEDDRRIAGLEVGLVVQHPRVSDLVTHLISPLGKRILLVENRGGTDDSGYGGGNVFTNVFPTVSSGDFEANTNILDVGANQGTLIVDYEFFQIPDQLRVFYDNQLIKDTGLVSGSNTFSIDFGPGVATDLVITMNEGNNANTNTAWTYTTTVIGDTVNYLVLTEDTNKTTTPIKFAMPPLGGVNASATGAVVFADGFEAEPQGNYAAPVVIGPWQVVTNDVDVFSTGYQGVPAPPEPNNFLDINGAGSGGAASGGVLETILTMLTPGQNYLLQFSYARNPDSIVDGIFPEAEVTIGTEVQELVQPLGASAWTNLAWQTTGASFTATTTNLALRIASLTSGTNGVLFDKFEIAEITEQDRFFQPEESLNLLVGDNAEGLWQLELWDNRAGAFTGPPTLVSWQLRFIYDTVVQVPFPLQPGVAITNTIPPGEIFQLVVDVPIWASFATNTLIFATNDPVNIWLNPTNLITTTSAGDVLQSALVNADTFTLDAGSTPPVVPGGRYFVGIENPSVNPVTFAYRVDFDITSLTNGVPLTATLGTNQFGAFLRYFSYDVSTNNPAAVTFDLFNLDGNVDLIASFGQLPRPLTGFYDYGSFNFGANDENITIFPDSTPVNLAPGRWYLGVLLTDNQPVNYTIQATELTNDLSGIITLTNAIPYTNRNDGVSPIEDFYRFSVTDPVQRLQFEILGPSADMTLLVNKGLPLPNFANFDYLSANPGTNDEYILVLPGSTPVDVSAGEWFLTALNLSGQVADYAIKATQWTETGQPITIRQPSLLGPNFCFPWDSLAGAQYVVQAKVDLSDINWVDYSQTITATDIVTGYCVPLPSPYQFFRVIEGVAVDPGSTAQIRITDITVGPGTVTLEWQAPPTFRFRVEYSDGLPAVWMPFGPPAVTSTDGNFTFTDLGPLPPTARFYRIVLLP